MLNINCFIYNKSLIQFSFNTWFYFFEDIKKKSLSSLSKIFPLYFDIKNFVIFIDFVTFVTIDQANHQASLILIRREKKIVNGLNKLID